MRELVERFIPIGEFVRGIKVRKNYADQLKSLGVDNQSKSKNWRKVTDINRLQTLVEEIKSDQPDAPNNNFSESVAQFHKLNGGKIKG